MRALALLGAMLVGFGVLGLLIRSVSLADKDPVVAGFLVSPAAGFCAIAAGVVLMLVFRMRNQAR